MRRRVIGVIVDWCLVQRRIPEWEGKETKRVELTSRDCACNTGAMPFGENVRLLKFGGVIRFPAQSNDYYYMYDLVF